MREILLTDMQIVRTRMPNSGIRFLGTLHNRDGQLAVLFWVYYQCKQSETRA